MPIEIGQGQNRNDQSCDFCGGKLEKTHIKLMAESPGTNRVLDFHDGCAIVVGTRLIQASPIELDPPIVEDHQ